MSAAKGSKKSGFASPMVRAVCVGAALIFTALTLLCMAALAHQFDLWVLLTTIFVGGLAWEYWHLAITRQRPHFTALFDFLWFTRP